MQRYKTESLMTEVVRILLKQSLEADLYVQTIKRGGMKKIEILGIEQCFTLYFGTLTELYCVSV